MLLIPNKTLAILGLSLGLLFFNSCKKNASSVRETTVEEDKENVEQLFDNIVNQAEDFDNGCAVKSVKDFLNLDNGEVWNEQWLHDITEALRVQLDYDYVEQTRKLNFNSHTGTYQWSMMGLNHVFLKTPAPTDKIIVKAPSKEGQNSNNAVATISSYTQQSTIFDGETYWLPNTVKFEAQVDGTDCIGLELERAVYDNGTFMVPTEAKFKLFLAPFSFDIELNKTGEHTYDFEVTAFNDNVEKFSIETEITFSDDDFSDFIHDRDIDKAIGKIHYDNFTLPFDVNIEALYNLLNPTQAQINEMIKVSIEYNNNKIADLSYQNSNDPTIIIEYRDGSIQDLENEFVELQERLEVVFSDFINDNE